MVITKVREDLIHTVDDVVGVKITLVGLGFTDDVDSTVSDSFEFRIRMSREGVTYGLDPLGKVTVLKQETIELVILRLAFGKDLEAAVSI